MSKKQNSLMRFSRTERLAQLSEQEIVIERKKREIQAKIEAQKKKQTEEALKKLESSKEAKKPGFTKKSGTGTEHEKSNDKEKTIEQVNESRINAFSNDGSFLDQFKKLSQSGLSAKAVHVQTFTKSQVEESYKKNRSLHDKDVSKETREKGGSTTERDNQPGNENSQSFLNQNPLDSRIQCNVPPSNVANMINQQQSALVLNSTVNNPAKTVSLHSAYVPQFQGGVKNPVHAFNSKISQLNSSQSNFPCSLQSVPAVQYPQLGVVSNTSKQDDSVSSEEGNHFPTNLLASIKPPCTVGPQNIPPPFPIQVQNIPPPPVPPTELPKLRSESISLTLKGNTVKKLEAIPNPLAIDQPPSPPSPKRNPLGFTGTKESSKESFFNATTVVENVSSHDRESSRISSAFYNNDEDGKDSGELLDEKSHHWAELVARYGDSFEDSLRNRIQNDAKTRFLLDKNSKEYMTFRKLVLMYQKRLKSSEEESIGKTRKLNRPSYDGSTEEIISHSNAVKYSETKSIEEEDFDSKECLGSERMASVDRQENQTHSKYYESRENYLPKKKISELTSEDCLLPSQKQLFPREKSGANSKEGKYELISEQSKNEERPRRKRKSRWGDAIPTTSTPGVATNISLQPAGKLPAPKSTLLSQLTRSDPGLIQYAKQTFGSTNLSEEDWKKAEDHYKINLLYQDMVKKRAEVEKLEKQGKFKYEYDSDEDTEGGTWEHKLRQQEMQATQLWAEELTRQAAGKHHIGDFLPPEELERFMEKYNAVKEGREPDLSDYKEYKLKEDNVGYRLLQKMGWNEGQGLGQDGSGITNPVNKATTRHENQGLGIERPDGLEPGDDEYDAYRKRMMLAYRFRPNPLNNPRRPYY